MNPAPISRRFVAFLIDFLVVYFFRYLYILISLRFFLKNSVLIFISQYEEKFGKFNFKNITKIQLDFFLKSKIFKLLIIFIIGYFLISSIYHFIFLLSKWSASLGQRLLKLSVIDYNEERPTFIKIFFRSLLSPLPWMFIFFILFNQFLYQKVGENTIDKQNIILYIFVFSSWYDLVFITEKRLNFLDVITRTKLVTTNEYEKVDFIKYIFPSFKKTFLDLKYFTIDLISKVKSLIKFKKDNKDKKKDNKNKKSEKLNKINNKKNKKR